MAATFQSQNDSDVSRNSNGQKDSNRSSSEGVILGGGLRGAIGFLTSNFKVKMMVYKRAFLAIGEQTMGNEKSVVTPTQGRWVHSRTMVYTQSTLMGMVVFGTYDGLVYAWHHHRGRRTHTNAGLDHWDGEMTSRGALGASSMLVHAFAGGASGVSRSLFWIGWERLVYDIPHSWAFSWRSTVHHALGHGVLFGSYYSLRTFALEMRDLPILRRNNGDDWFPLMVTFLAGGVAGQLHHTSQHYTSHWRQFRSLHQLPPPPRIRPVLASFVPMALCFAVFEHGGDSAEEMVSQVQNML